MKKRFLFLFFVSGLVLMNACQKEYSFENGTGPSEGTLQDDGSGDCLPKTVSGAYVVGTALNGTSNYIEVQVDVIKTGSYTIYTDTVNGIYFRATGIFTSTGLATVQLKGNGTPIAQGIHNFIVRYGASGCTIAVTTASTLASFTLDGAPGGCMGASVAGAYSAGIALNATNTVTINVNVTTPGAYNLSSATSNGMTFMGSGIFVSTGPQAIVLTGTGTPATGGSTNIPVTAGSSTCSFVVDVTGAAAFTFNCAATVVNGTYTAGTALTSANTVTVTLNVTTAGAYSISTAPVNGITFAGSGNFTATGTQTVTLSGAGTPATAGTSNISLSGSCTFPVTVAPAGGAATFTITCPSTVVNGTYTAGTALGAGNTVTLTVNVTATGTYAISTTPIDGMTFSATGSFSTTGSQTVTLAGTGTPVSPGTITVSMSTGSCTFPVTVAPAAGAATFTVNCPATVVNGTYKVGTTLTAANTAVLTVNVTTVGSYAISTTPVNGMTFMATGTFTATGTQTVTMTGTGTPATAGSTNVSLTTGTCTFAVTVAPAAGAATFAVNCGSAVVNGTYTAGTALGASNTIGISVNVTTAGTYTISTTATNGMTFSATGNFASTGTQNVTLTGSGTPTASGTFNIPVTSGTTPCNFPLTVAPATTPIGTWSFTEGTNNFSGTFSDAGMDDTFLPPFVLFYMVGETTAGHYFEMDLLDVSAVLQNGETYNAAVWTGTSNTAIFYFEGPPPASPILYQADFSIVPNSMVITITNHNTTTKTITGTFAGNVQDEAGATKTISNGVFTITYP